MTVTSTWMTGVKASTPPSTLSRVSTVMAVRAEEEIAASAASIPTASSTTSGSSKKSSIRRPRPASSAVTRLGTRSRINQARMQ